MLATLAVLTAASVLAPDAKAYTMRLNLRKGQTFKYRLLIERDQPKSRGEFVSGFKISKIEGNTMYMDGQLQKLSIDGKDRTKDLKVFVGDQTITWPWTIYSRRTGSIKGINFRPGHPEVVPYLKESGVYLAHFQRQEVKPGESWNGSTTASGGCTGAKYTFKEVKTVSGKQLAYFDVTDIRFLNAGDAQVGPMKMIVDLSTGLPDLVDYKVKNKAGVTTHIRQTKI